MLNFSNFLIEMAGEGLSSNIGSIKTKGHIQKYVFPYLSSEGKKQSVHDLHNFFSEKDNNTADQNNNGKLYNSKTNFTHKMASSHNEHKKGTAVKVKSLYKNGSTIMARTEKHGDMPISKLGKPAEVAAAPKTKEGFELEKILQNNVDPRYTPAGSSGESYDFVAGDPNSDETVRGKAVKKNETPLFRGESKNSKKGTVAMGTMSVVHNPKTGKWEYSSKTKSKMQPVFEKAKHENGKTILEHLNDIAPNGKLKTGFHVDAPEGTTSHYINAGGINALHLHRYAKDKNGNYIKNYGTSYTVGHGNVHVGKLGLGHLSDENLKELDGKIHVEASGEGKAQLKHRPRSAVFNKFADFSVNDPINHRDLSREDHAAEFRQKYANHIKELSQANVPVMRKPVFKAIPSEDEDRFTNEGGPAPRDYDNDGTWGGSIFRGKTE